MNGGGDMKGDMLSSSDVPMTFMVNVFDAQKRSRHLELESARRPYLTCQSATLITLICSSMHSPASPRIVRALLRSFVNLFTLLVWFNTLPGFSYRAPTTKTTVFMINGKVIFQKFTITISQTLK